ncbi:hypothetical protein LTR10_019199 [Elasticomyces elasticus]|uniref:Thioredoxin-like protein AAED1 n=1 Tax=Exophiala sideris TaxID=1016849 RepID=A0ABR0JNS6_9EURO|nr:hypothetical protein LTR10_019199 [Elasticomyces elasticus]KAK5038119.1 hypothetical protein LTS07_001588 [Exophiala sideris]KAK5044103.1 hypothetical protein LTR13_000459 [Exophiala sideris]KAK5067603.1 hypothetical protein LTR69_001592 [Exophiala sideris]KAK5184158.1 hypothetical protein LTR44_003664 [Eurotiomycetes sp. CCFEE 6388]
MAVENAPSPSTLKQAFEHQIYSSDAKPVPFGSLFDNVQGHQSVLVIFIRHFFCGNCQEYVRRLSSSESPFHPSKPASQRPLIIIIGPGFPSLIASYVALTECPFTIYADPSTRLYDILGMHRTLSMGPKNPEYIQRSLVGNAVKSAWQILRRVGTGDAMSGGDLDVNGGEFLFVHRNTTKNNHHMSGLNRHPTISRRLVSTASSSSLSTIQWEVSWCHRMLNSRDHTELAGLETQVLGASSQTGSRTTSPPRPILARGTPYLKDTRSYSHDHHGSCPGPDIPKSRDEAMMKQHLQKIMSTPNQHTRSPSRSSVIKRPHSRARSRAESRASQPTIQEHEVEDEDEMQQRKGFTASLTSKVGGVLRSKSFSSKSSRRPTVSSEDAGEIHAHSRKRSSPNLFTLASKPSVSHRPQTAAASQARSDSAQVKVESHSRSASNGVSISKVPSVPRMPTLSRTFSMSAARPLSRKAKGQVQMDENGVMLVDGVEFVNVISLRARVDSGFGGSPEKGSQLGEQNDEARVVVEEVAAA